MKRSLQLKRDSTGIMVEVKRLKANISSTRIRDIVTQRDVYNPDLVLKDNARAVSLA